MNWDGIGAIAEMLGAIAVLISIFIWQFKSDRTPRKIECFVLKVS
jgi:hypothetical protein